MHVPSVEHVAKRCQALPSVAKRCQLARIHPTPPHITRHPSSFLGCQYPFVRTVTPSTVTPSHPSGAPRPSTSSSSSPPCTDHSSPGTVPRSLRSTAVGIASTSPPPTHPRPAEQVRKESIEIHRKQSSERAANRTAAKEE